MYGFLAVLVIAVLPAGDHQVFAHRGASGYLPEHSLPAKAMAYAQGADYLEQDVVLTKDNVPIVLHDVHLDSLTDVARRFPGRKRDDGRFYAIDFTIEEIRELKATQRFQHDTGKPAHPERFPVSGHTYQLHTLEEEIRFIQGLNASTGRNVGLFVEIKQPTFHQKEGRDIAKIVFDLLRKTGYGADRQSPCWVQCFEKSTLKRFRDDFGWQGRLMMILSNNPLGADGTDYDQLATPEGLRDLATFADGVFPNLARVVSWNEQGEPIVSTFTTDARQAGLRVITGVVRKDALPKNCPSVDAYHEAVFEKAKVDDICTDFPDLSSRWINKQIQREKR